MQTPGYEDGGTWAPLTPNVPRSASPPSQVPLVSQGCSSGQGGEVAGDLAGAGGLRRVRCLVTGSSSLGTLSWVLQ